MPYVTVYQGSFRVDTLIDLCRSLFHNYRECVYWASVSWRCHREMKDHTKNENSTKIANISEINSFLFKLSCTNFSGLCRHISQCPLQHVPLQFRTCCNCEMMIWEKNNVGTGEHVCKRNSCRGKSFHNIANVCTTKHRFSAGTRHLGTSIRNVHPSGSYKGLSDKSSLVSSP